MRGPANVFNKLRRFMKVYPIQMKRYAITAGEIQNITIELWYHLVDVLELFLAISYNGPQLAKFFRAKKSKI